MGEERDDGRIDDKSRHAVGTALSNGRQVD